MVDDDRQLSKEKKDADPQGVTIVISEALPVNFSSSYPVNRSISKNATIASRHRDLCYINRVLVCTNLTPQAILNTSQSRIGFRHSGHAHLDAESAILVRWEADNTYFLLDWGE